MPLGMQVDLGQATLC